jgi:hypothetical protein
MIDEGVSVADPRRQVGNVKAAGNTLEKYLDRAKCSTRGLIERASVHAQILAHIGPITCGT